MTQAVLLDGAGGPSELPTGCHHGTPWYVEQLAAAAMAHMRKPNIGLNIALLRAISWVAQLHRDYTCDLGHPGTPASTIVMVRYLAGKVEYLVLGDSTFVADVNGKIVTVKDRRIEAVATGLWRAMAALPTGTPEHQAARIRFVEHQRRMRNHPHGYPAAGVDPDAARDALTGDRPLAVGHPGRQPDHPAMAATPSPAEPPLMSCVVVVVVDGREIHHFHRVLGYNSRKPAFGRRWMQRERVIGER